MTRTNPVLPLSFEALFSIPPQVTAQVPGRVNLMGEHTDYNQGFVLPTILRQQTIVQMAISAPDSGPDPDTNPGVFEAWSDAYPEFTQRHLSEQPQGHWTDYILACLQQLAALPISLPNLKIRVESTIPIGAGLSSSAALEIAVLRALRSLLNLSFTDLEIAKMAQRAEQEGIGMPCGIMDQMVCALGQPHQAFFLDTQTLTFEQIPLPQDYAFVVVHSGTTHALVTSGYKQRRQDCEAAAHALKVNSLRNVTLADLEAAIDLPQILRKRATHVVTENERVLATVTALRQNHIPALGQLMNDSHRSQKEAFEVTVPATDQLWELTLELGAIGARQTGGGFGGAIVALLPTPAVPTWSQEIAAAGAGHYRVIPLN
jgi:galactokinase